MRTVNLLKQIYVLLLLVYFTPLTLAKDNPNNSEYKDNIKIIEEKVNGYLKSWYPEYNKKDNCYFHQITEERKTSEEFGDAEYFCLSVKKIEYQITNKIAYILIEGQAFNKKFEMIEDLPANNEQKYEILMLTIRFDNLKKSDEQLRFGQSEFFTDRTQNEGDIVCINSNKKIGIVLIHQA